MDQLGGEVSIEESISIPEEYSPILQENLKLQEEKNKLLTLNNSLESQVNIMHADLEVSELKINDLRQQESQLTEKNISLEAEIKRLKNSISDVREDHRNEPDVFFGFTRTEMAQVCQFFLDIYGIILLVFFGFNIFTIYNNFISAVGENLHFVISGYFLMSVFIITGIHCIFCSYCLIISFGKTFSNTL